MRKGEVDLDQDQTIEVCFLPSRKKSRTGVCGIFLKEFRD